jgi:hypothetical protein
MYQLGGEAKSRDWEPGVTAEVGKGEAAPQSLPVATGGLRLLL